MRAMAKKKFPFDKKVRLYDPEIFLFLRETAEEEEESGFLPTYFFDICSLESCEVLGRCDLRIGDNEATYYAGNIGYRVEEQFRGNHYALKACLLLEMLAKRHGMRRLIITCDPDNIPSRRTCELFGASYLETVRVPESHILYSMGERRKSIYQKILLKRDESES